MFNRVIAFFLVVVFTTGILPVSVFSQSNTEPLPGMDRSVFDYHFSRADRETDPERWLFEARAGISLAVKVWENCTVDMFDSIAERDEAKYRVIEWSEEELELRFTQWLINRFFGQDFEKITAQFASAVSELHKNHAYYHDENGAVLLDDLNGNPVLVKAGDSERKFNDDLYLWQNESQSNLLAIWNDYENAMRNKYPQMLAFISDDLRDAFGKIAAFVSENNISLAKTEFENIAAREERLFTARRTGEYYKLYKNRNIEQISDITDDLINQVQALCDEKVYSLQSRIEKAENYEGDLAFMGAEWLQMYREQFEQGMKIWEEAEEKFFLNRIEWEQNAMTLYEQSKEEWFNAFLRLQNEREKWELQVKKIFESGLSVFIKASEDLEASINEARSDFEKNIATRIESGISEAVALFEIYFTYANARKSEKEYAQSLMDQYYRPLDLQFDDDDAASQISNQISFELYNLQDAYRRLSLYDLKSLVLNNLAAKAKNGNAADVAQYNSYNSAFQAEFTVYHRLRDFVHGTYNEEERDAVVALIKTGRIASTGKVEKLIELEKSYRQFMAYSNKAAEVQELITKEFWDVFGEDSLNDYLNGNIAGGNFIPDENQIALIKAKTEIDYWKKKMELALEINAYVKDIENKKITEEDIMTQWEKTKNEYEFSIAIYEEELKKLTEIDGILNENKKAIDEFSQKIFALQERMDTMNQEYENIIAIYSMSEIKKVEAEIKGKYEELLKIYRIIMNTDNAFYMRELKLASKLDILDAESNRIAILDMLTNGNGDQVVPLRDLQELFGSILIFDAGKYSPESSSELGIDSNDPRYAMINDLITERNHKINEVDSDDDNADKAASLINKHYNTIILQFCIAIKNEHAAKLNIRNMEIELLNEGNDNQSGMEWYCNATGKELTENEMEMFYRNGIDDFLYNDYIEKYYSLITKRLLMEKKALEMYLDNPGDMDAISSNLIQFYAFGREVAEIGIESLDLLLERLENNLPCVSGGSELNDVIAWFIAGGSFFSINNIYINDEICQFLLAEGLYNAYINYGGYSKFIGNEQEKNIKKELSLFCNNYGILADGTKLPDISCFFEKLAKSDDVLNETALFLAGIDKIFKKTPAWLNNEIYEWIVGLAEQIAVYMVVNEIHPGNDTAYFDAKLLELEGRINEYGEMLGSISMNDLNIIKELNTVYGGLMEEKSFLEITCLISYIYQKIDQYVNSYGSNNWRQYLDIVYFEGQEEIAACNDVKDGLFADACERSKYLDLRFGNALNIYYSDEAMGNSDDFDLLLADYLYEAESNHGILFTFEYKKSEIIDFGPTLRYTFLDEENFDMAMKEKKNEIRLLEENIANKIAEHREYLEIIYAINEEYYNQFIIAKNAHKNINEKFQDFEKFNSIKQYFLNAYYNFDNNDAEEYREKMERAVQIYNILYEINSNLKYENSDSYNIFIGYETANSDLIFLKEIVGLFDNDYAKAKKISDTAYSKLLKSIRMLETKLWYPEDYVSPEEKTNWGIIDCIDLKNGKLTFSHDDNFVLNGIDQNEAKILNDYYNLPFDENNLKHFFTNYENQTAMLASRMYGYLDSKEDFIKWGMARDYILRKIKENNTDIAYFKKMVIGSEALDRYQSLGKLSYQIRPFVDDYDVSDLINYFQTDFFKKQEMYWNMLDTEEKEDLLFYTILTLIDPETYDYGFSQYTALMELEFAYQRTNANYQFANKKTKNWLTGGFLYYKMKNVNKLAMDKINVTLAETKSIISRWETEIQNISQTINYNSINYSLAIAAIDRISNKNDNGIGWPDILQVLYTLDKKEQINKNNLEYLWNEITKDNNIVFVSVIEAINYMYEAAIKNYKTEKIVFEEKWQNEYYNKIAAEAEYNVLSGKYINGDAEYNEILGTAENLLMKNSFSWKQNFADAGGTALNSIFEFYKYGSESNMFLINDYIEFLGTSINMGAISELKLHEIEWDLMRTDLYEKIVSWNKTMEYIAERGRSDWELGYQKMNDSFVNWSEKYMREYNIASNLWNEAYLAGLEDKEKWLLLVEEAANSAMSTEMLGLIGSEAERYSRIFDTRNFTGNLPTGAAEEAENIMKEILSGNNIRIVFDNDFIKGFNLIGYVPVMKIYNGIENWNSNSSRINAAVAAQETNKVIAERESRKMAKNAKNAVNEALDMLKSKVNETNDKFRKSMDNVFILKGQWKRSGNYYRKEIVKGSTVFKPLIYDERAVNQYNDYILDSIMLNTRLDEDYLNGLESYAIQTLMKNAFDEIDTITEDLFGDGKDIVIKESYKEMRLGIVKIPVRNNESDQYSKSFSNNSHGINFEEVTIEVDERYMRSGKIGSHIGYLPAVRSNHASDIDAMFYDKGKGELGRLMTYFIFYDCMESKGLAEVNLATWNKRLWDDSNSVLSAPSMRSLTDVVLQVGVGILAAAGTMVTGGMSIVGMIALETAILSSGSFVYNSLDAAFGYKKFDEALFDFGKAFTINAISSAGSAFFGGIKNVSNEFFRDGIIGKMLNKSSNLAEETFIKVMGNAVQSTTTGFLNNFVGSIYLDDDRKLAFSGKNFTDGMESMYKNTLVSMTTITANGILTGINSGYNLERIAAYSSENTERMKKLNSVLSGLAGQGVSYALGEDFTLNLLNTSIIELFGAGEQKHNIGLLEYHLGKDGKKSMNIGTGGTDVGINTLLDSGIASLLWGTDVMADIYGEVNDINIEYTFQALFNSGDKEGIKQALRILFGKDDIIIDTSQEYGAKTDNIHGKRTIIIGDYRDDLSIAEQVALAAILAQEAYRDSVSGDANFEEFRNAHMARIDLATRFNEDHPWFFTLFKDYLAESIILEDARETGSFLVFDTHLSVTYSNEEDYYWIKVTPGGEFQSDDRYRKITLLAGKTLEEIARANDDSIVKAIDYIVSNYEETGEYSKSVAEFFTEDGIDTDGLMSRFKTNESLQKEFGLSLMKHETLYSHGCMLFSLMYGLESITNKNYDAALLNEWMVDNGHFTGNDKNELSTNKIAEVLNILLGGFYDASVFYRGAVDYSHLIGLNYSKDAFLVHLRVLDPKNPEANPHSVMVDRIDYEYDDGLIVGVKGIYVANPWNREGTFSGKDYYTFNEIVRMDIFEITPTSLYYKYKFYNEEVSFPQYVTARR